MRLIDRRQQYTDHVGFEESRTGKREQFLGTFVVINDESGDGTV
jgi:hypothetical protein